MKKHIDIFDYAGAVCKAMSRGILLTTKRGEEVNTMTIGWGTVGIEWGKPVFVAYVRESRHTRVLLDETGEFTVNIPIDGIDRNIIAVCGTKSGRDLNKIEALNLTLEEPDQISVPGIKELPLTIECKVLFRNVQDESRLPEPIRSRFYTGGSNEADYHIAYYAEILSAYIIE